MTLKDKLIKGGFYLVAVNVFSQILGLVNNIVLTKLLLPEHFGIVALSVSVLGFITLFLAVGFGSSIIYFQDASENQLSSIFWMNLFLSFFQFVVVITASKFIAVFFSEPQIAPIIQISAISLLITPFYITQYKMMERDLDFI